MSEPITWEQEQELKSLRGQIVSLRADNARLNALAEEILECLQENYCSTGITNPDSSTGSADCYCPACTLAKEFKKRLK